MRCNLLLLAIISGSFPVFPAEPADSVIPEVTLEEVTVAGGGVRRLQHVATNSRLITSGELKRAACCNLGESFTTNPSVDVSYSDAATGARQIKLLGLAGTYVQMLMENVPALRIAASPYGLSFIPGPWMNSIQVSKGASSVKNGYESLTGQINIELKKPQNDRQLNLNGYVDHRGKAELNADGNIYLSDKLSSGLMLHAENSFKGHDENSDGFIDMPMIRQFSGLNRWAWMGDNYIMQTVVRGLHENRRSGQRGHGSHHAPEHPYLIDVSTDHWEAFTKNAYIFDPDNSGNVALILSGNTHNRKSEFGNRRYDVLQRTLYASLMFERTWTERHALSSGLSFDYDNLHQSLSGAGMPPVGNMHETTGGAYAQYTLTIPDRLVAMAGLRFDYSSLWGSMVTPRAHLRYTPSREITLLLSAGKGRRTAYALAENSHLLASSRAVIVPDGPSLEEGWNFGAGAELSLGALSLSADYYFTSFQHQLAADFNADPHSLVFRNIDGHSRSHTAQAEITWRIIPELEAIVAARFTDVRLDYGRGMEAKPLQGKWKGLVSLSYTPMMGLWQFDATLAINGGGTMPDPFTLPDGTLSWARRFSTYPQLNAQITRNFRHWAVYLGGENLTGYVQPDAIIGASDPWGPGFDATMVYGPLHGAVIYLGFRYNLTIY